MGFFHIWDANDVDQELYERVWARYEKKYPEVNEPDFEPNFSGHDEDWDTIWDEEYIRLEKERYVEGTGDKNMSSEDEYEDPEIYGPQAKLPPKKKKKPAKPKQEETSTTENCSSEQNPNASTCYYDKFTCTIEGGSLENPTELKFYNDQGTRIFYSKIGFACNCDRFNVPASDYYRISFNIVNNHQLCDEHKGCVFIIYGNNYKVHYQDDVQLTIDVFSTWEDDLKDIYHNITLGHKPENIRVIIDQCGSREEIEIEVVPRYSFNLDLAVAFNDRKSIARGSYGPKNEYDDGPKNKPAGDPEIDPRTHMKTQPKISLTKNYNGIKQDWGAEFGTEKMKAVGRVSRVIDKMFAFTEKYLSGEVQMTVKMPTIAGSGKWEYTTDETRFKLSRVGSYEAKLSPLLGFGFEINLAKGGTPVGKAVGKFLELAEYIKTETKGKEDLKLDIIVGIMGEINFSILQKFDTPAVTTTFGSSLTVYAKAEAVFKLESWICKFVLTGSVDLQAKFSFAVTFSRVFSPIGKWTGTFDGLDGGLAGKYDVGIGWFSSTEEFSCRLSIIDKHTLWDLPFYMP